MRDDKVAILVNRLNLHFLVVGGQYALLVLEELDELIGHYIGHFHFTDVQGCAVPFPHHVVHKVAIILGWHDRDLALVRKQARRLVQQLLLDEHAAIIGGAKEPLGMRWSRNAPPTYGPLDLQLLALPRGGQVFSITSACGI